jgi:acyl-coenzyme A synthetase/AMP-(fatty) acid ligase
MSSSVVGIFEENQGNDLIFGFVVKDPLNIQLTEDFIMNHVNNKVIDAKKLRGGVHFLDALPMTPSGKIQRPEVKKIAQKIYEPGHQQ